MAEQKNTPAKEKKERKPARTIEQQIEDLRAKAERRQSKETAKATKAVTDLEAKITVAESKLGNLYADLAKAQAVLGIDTSRADAAVETYSPAV